MRFKAIQEQKVDYSIEWMCRALKVSRSSYYCWLNQTGSPKPDRDGFLLLQIKAISDENFSVYGSPRIHRELRHQGIRTSRKRVARIMQEHGLCGRTSRKRARTTRVNAAEQAAENILGRDFRSVAVNEKWVTDITAISTSDGFLYLSAIVDLFSNRIVGFAMSCSMEVELCIKALDQAVRLRSPAPGLVHHSDRGSQYTSKLYQQRLKDHGMVCSMSRKGECWDNACAESFFGRLKEELIYGRTWHSHAQAEQAIRNYIERFWNVKRIQKKLDYQCPISYEISASVGQLAA